MRMHDLKGWMKLHDLKSWLKQESSLIVKYLRYGVIGTMKLHDLTGWLKECTSCIDAVKKSIWKASRCKILCILYAFVAGRSFDMGSEFSFTVFRFNATIKHKLIKLNGYYLV